MSLLRRRKNHQRSLPTMRPSLPDWMNFDPFFDFDDWFQRDRLPACNILNQADHYVIEVAAPGLQRDNFSVEVQNGILTISAEKSESEEEEEDNYTRREFNYRSFSRSFSLPTGADEEEIEAKYDDGVLSISIAKRPEAQREPVKMIEIS